MKKSDRTLGMDRDISRRDFLNGVSVAVGASLLPGAANAQDVGAQDLPGYYPPALTGLRGSHPGSFEAAHSLRDGASFTPEILAEHYDLVVVGAGISGLSAAYFYQQKMGPDARILILENHDDFGGHAKRNEFEVDGKEIIGYGGTMLIEAPKGYPDNAKRLLKELGIETERFYEYFDQEIYSSLGLQRGLFFDEETFGNDHLAVGRMSDPALFANAPLSAEGKADLVRLFKDERHYLDDVPKEKRAEFLANMDYQTYLADCAGMGDEALKVMLPAARGVWAINIDAYPADAAWSGGYPGFGDLKLRAES